jgi:hypothetical protein
MEFVQPKVSNRDKLINPIYTALQDGWGWQLQVTLTSMVRQCTDRTTQHTKESSTKAVEPNEVGAPLMGRLGSVGFSQ